MGALIFLLVGLVFLVAGGWHGVRTWRFVARATAATGHVVVVPDRPAARRTEAHPTMEFIAPGGSTARYSQNGMGARDVGTAVPLLYDAAVPAETAVARGFWTQWFPVIGPPLLGLAFMVVAL